MFVNVLIKILEQQPSQPSQAAQIVHRVQHDDVMNGMYL